MAPNPNAKKLKPKIRVVYDYEGLPPKELKKRLANNLDSLLRVLGLSRKDAAAEIGISYPLMRRLATAGVSRLDDLNREALSSVANYFCVSIDLLWIADLRRWLLTPGNPTKFAEKFRDRLIAEQQRRQSALGPAEKEDLALIGQAFGGEPAPLTLPAEVTGKVLVILNSGKGRQFRNLIEDYFEFVTREEQDSDRHAVNE